MMPAAEAANTRGRCAVSPQTTVTNARLAMRKIERGKDKGEAIQKLEKKLDEFAEESKKLKDRLDKLESLGT